MFKTCTTRCKTISKQSSEKLSTSWTAKPWPLWKLLHTSSNESTCVQLHASDIQLVTSENSWHQIPKQWNEHHMNWHFKTWKSSLQLANTYKPINNFCKMFGQLLQTELENPGNCFLHSFCKQPRTDSFCCFLDGLCNEKRVHQTTKMQANAKTTDALKFKWLASLCNPTFWISAASLWNHGYWSGPGKDQTRWTSRPHKNVLFS